MKRVKAAVAGLFFCAMTGGMVASVWQATAGKTDRIAKESLKKEAPKEESQSEVDTAEIYVLKDGEYEGTGNGFGGQLSVKVMIKDGEITDIQVLENRETPEYLEMAKAMIEDMIRAQSAEVDVVSGATFSSNGIKDAVRAALDGIEKVKVTVSRKGAEKKKEEDSGKSEPGEQNKDEKQQNQTADSVQDSGTQSFSMIQKDDQTELADGEYEGSGQGYRGTITVRVSIQNGQLADIELVSAQDDPPYLGKAKSVITSLLDSQGSVVDTVSGATYSSKGIIAAVNDALAKALRNKPTAQQSMDQKPLIQINPPSVQTNDSTVQIPEQPKNNQNTKKKTDRQASLQEGITLKDGSYEAEATEGQYFQLNGPSKLRLEVKNGKLHTIDLLTFADDESYAAGSETVLVKQRITRLLTALSGADTKRVREVADQLINQKGEAYDSVSGATVSARGVMSAVVKALQAAGEKPLVKLNDQVVQPPLKTPQPSKPEQPQTSTPKRNQQVKPDKPKNESPKTEDTKPKTENPNTEKPKIEKPKNENPKKEKSKTEEPKPSTPKSDKPKVGAQDIQLSSEIELADGVYSGTASYGRYLRDRGANVVSVEIRDGRIIQVVSEVYTDDDMPPFRASRDRILTSVNGKTVAEILAMYDQMEKRNGADYDAVSHATQTAKGHLSAVMDALKQAAAKKQNDE